MHVQILIGKTGKSNMGPFPKSQWGIIKAQDCMWSNLILTPRFDIAWNETTYKGSLLVIPGKTLNERDICAQPNQNRNTECQHSQTRWNDYIRPAQFPDCSSSTTWVALCQLTPAAFTLAKASPRDLGSPAQHHGDHLHLSSSQDTHSSL